MTADEQRFYDECLIRTAAALADARWKDSRVRRCPRGRHLERALEAASRVYGEAGDGTMTRPTKEQLEQARAWFDEDLLDQLTCDGRADTVRKIRVLIAATAEPTGEELAGEALPDAVELARLCSAFAVTVDAAEAILDLFRPLVARLTQERNEAQLAARRWAGDVHTLRQRAERAERELVSAKRHADGFSRIVDTVEIERDAIRKRAEDAEQALAKVNEIRIQEHEENVDLRARIAELEASRGPGADVVENTAALLFDAREVALGRENEPGRRRRWALAVHSGGPSSVEREVATAQARAIIAHLAAMGEEAQIGPLLSRVQHAVECKAEHCSDRDAPFGLVDDICNELARLSPVIGALRARVAELEGAAAQPDMRKRELERALGGRCDVCKQVGDHARVCPMVGGLWGAQ